MLSPKIMAHESPLINVSPIIKAWTNPSGEGCTSYCKLMPYRKPLPNNRSKLGKSWGVDIIKISLIPASINIDKG